MARADSRVRVATACSHSSSRAFCRSRKGSTAVSRSATHVVHEGLAPGRGEPRQLGVVEPGAECVVDAAGDPGRVGGQGAADGGDAGQVALGIVGDELAHPGGQVLAAQFEGEGACVAGDDPLVVQEERGRADRAADHLHRVGVVVGVVREPASGEGDDEGDALLAPAGAARALGVVAGPGRDVAQDDRQQLAQVDAEFQGHGADQDVEVAVLEPVLDRLPRLQGHLAGVLGGQDDNRLRGGGQQPLVIVRVAAPGAHDPLAVERGAPVPRGAGGLDGPAGPAAVQVRRRRADLDGLRGDLPQPHGLPPGPGGDVFEDAVADQQLDGGADGTLDRVRAGQVREHLAGHRGDRAAVPHRDGLRPGGLDQWCRPAR